MFRFLDKIANWLPNREEVRRIKYESLKKKREKLLKKSDTEVNRRRIADIDRRLRDIENKAIAQ